MKIEISRDQIDFFSGLLFNFVTLGILVFLGSLWFLTGLTVNIWLFIIGLMVMFFALFIFAEDDNPEGFIITACLWLAFIVTCWTGEWNNVDPGDVYLDTDNQQMVVIQEDGVKHLPETYLYVPVTQKTFSSYETEIQDVTIKYEIRTSYTWLNLDFLVENSDHFLVYDVDSYVDDALISLHKENNLNQESAAQRFCNVLGNKGFDVTGCKVEFDEIKITEISTTITTSN
jgi:hypothetical protein